VPEWRFITQVVLRNQDYAQERLGKGSPLMLAKKRFSLKEAQQIGHTLGIDWHAFGVEQFRIGLEVELEHGAVDSKMNVSNDDAVITGKIALAHLKQFPDYYTHLTAMEKEADEYWADV
jgi:predicted phosphoribosyltransferase